ncbi:MAG: RidA family protein [Nitrospiraceae bacterium]|nr:RidA family protein [Nitrospiraceae bacterium]
MGRQNVSTGGPWEAKIGYSRAVRVGHSVQVSGTTAMTPSGLIGKGDPYAQTIQTLKTIEAALKDAGASLSDVVRTGIYMANMDHWQDVGRAHGEIFCGIRPATTMVEVKRLIDADMLVEIEADAIISASQAAEA